MVCRVIFNCTPRHQFLGFSPNGERLCFAEHVFYQFLNGRIAAAWLQMDHPAIEAQLRRSNKMTSTGMRSERDSAGIAARTVDCDHSDLSESSIAGALLSSDNPARSERRRA